MSLGDVTKEAVLTAVAECDHLGRDAFLSKYHFRPAKAYFLDLNGKLYDSKAIVGVAHALSGDRLWGPGDFSGGERTVAQRLWDLGFEVRILKRLNWTREEIILVCALVAANSWRTIAQEDSRAIDLSRILRSTTAIHPADARPDDFRNPAGVERKSGDLVSQLPNSGRKPTNGSRLDREVLEDFLHDPAAMHAHAKAIREALASWDDQPAAPEVVGPDIEAEEGGVLFKLHRRYERDARLKKRKLAEAKRLGIPVSCEACGFDFHRTYGERGLDYIECHHRTPLAATGPVKTQPSDLALICSNCHRMVHRTRQWLSVEELRDLVQRSRPAD